MTCGTFDLFHYGHLRILKRAREHGAFLVVGVLTDEAALKSKKKTIIPFVQRIEIVRAIKYVDEVVALQHCGNNVAGLNEKRNLIIKNKIDTFIMGDDWKNKFDHLRNLCDVKYLKRTPNISTTKIKAFLKI